MFEVNIYQLRSLFTPDWEQFNNVQYPELTTTLVEHITHPPISISDIRDDSVTLRVTGTTPSSPARWLPG